MFCGINSYNTYLNAVFRHCATCRSFIALPIICCSNLAQKSTVWVCQITNVVMKTTQLVLSHIKNDCSRWRIE